jgi:hypothetical protein
MNLTAEQREYLEMMFAATFGNLESAANDCGRRGAEDAARTENRGSLESCKWRRASGWVAEKIEKFSEQVVIDVRRRIFPPDMCSEVLSQFERSTSVCDTVMPRWRSTPFATGWRDSIIAELKRKMTGVRLEMDMRAKESIALEADPTAHRQATLQNHLQNLYSVERALHELQCQLNSPTGLWSEDKATTIRERLRIAISEIRQDPSLSAQDVQFILYHAVPFAPSRGSGEIQLAIQEAQSVVLAYIRNIKEKAGTTSNATSMNISISGTTGPIQIGNHNAATVNNQSISIQDCLAQLRRALQSSAAPSEEKQALLSQIDDLGKTDMASPTFKTGLDLLHKALSVSKNLSKILQPYIPMLAQALSTYGS